VPLQQGLDYTIDDFRARMIDPDAQYEGASNESGTLRDRVTTL